VEAFSNREYWLKFQDFQEGIGWKMFRSRNNGAQMSIMIVHKPLHGYSWIQEQLHGTKQEETYMHWST